MKRMILILMMILGVAIYGNTATTYTYVISPEGSFQKIQDGYLVNKVITNLGLKEAKDIYFSDGKIYIADSGNARVVIYDNNNESITQIKNEKMKSPAGISVVNGEIYVADPKAEKVFKFSEKGELTKEFEKPKDITYGKAPFRPSKVDVDRLGNLYIVSEGVGDGVIQMSNNGEFHGFYASNKASITFLDKLQDRFLTKELKSKLFAKVPPAFSSIYLDRNSGMLFATVLNDATSDSKKFNVAGKDVFKSGIKWGDSIDITVSSDGTVYTVYQFGDMSVQTNEGKLLFYTGGNSQIDRGGLFSKLASVTVDNENNVWLLDEGKGSLHVLSPTEFTKNVFSAISAFNGGDFEDADKKWGEILRQNELFAMANDGLGKTAILKRDYRNAMEKFAVAGDRSGYSDAFWEIRNNFLQRNVGKGILGVIILSLLNWVIGKVDRKKGILNPLRKIKNNLEKKKFIQDVEYAKYILKHPVDGFFELRRGKSGSTLVASILILLLYIVFISSRTMKGFIFQLLSIEDQNIFLMSLAFFILLSLFIGGNYLVASIDDGIGSLNQVYKMVGYAVVPFIILMPLRIVFTHFLTLNEVFILELISVVTSIWVFVNITIGLQETHNFLYRKAIKNLILTFVFMIIAIIIVAIIIILGGQIFSLIGSVIREVR